MSYEKVSGIRFNYNKNILDLKSHSNNDNATPTWWSFCEGKDIKERVLELYKASWLEGYIQIGGFTGQALNFKYGFIVYKKYLEEHNEEPTLDNVGILLIAITTTDTKDYCEIRYGGGFIHSFTQNGFKYSYSETNAKKFTFKQTVMFMKRFSKKYEFKINYLVENEDIRLHNLF